MAYKDNHWRGILLSEVLLSLGSISLFSIFILLSCYWYHQLRKVDGDSHTFDREILGITIIIIIVVVTIVIIVIIIVINIIITIIINQYHYYHHHHIYYYHYYYYYYYHHH